MIEFFAMSPDNAIDLACLTIIYIALSLGVTRTRRDRSGDSRDRQRKQAP